MRGTILLFLFLLILLNGCSYQPILSQSAEKLLLVEEDLPSGWSQYLDQPKWFDEWPAEDRLKAQKRGYIDGHQRTFVNGSEGMIKVANSIYSGVDMDKLYRMALEDYNEPYRIQNDRNETLERLPNPEVGQHSFAYKVTISDEKFDQPDFFYYEFYFTQGNVQTHMFCLVQVFLIEEPYAFCESLLRKVDERIKHERHSPFAPKLKDTLIAVPVKEFLPTREDFPPEWGIIQDNPINRKSLPPEMNAAAGPGQLIEGHLRVFANDTKNKIYVVNSLYANVVDKNTFAPAGNASEDIMMAFTRLTALDVSHKMKMINGRPIGERTWWTNLTRADNSTYINVFFGAKNMMVEVTCDMPSYDAALAWCDKVAQIIFDKIPYPSTDYALQQESVPETVPSILPEYDRDEIIKKAKKFLEEQYNLPNGSVGAEVDVTEYNGTKLTIKHTEFQLEYLIVKLNMLKDTYGDNPLEEVIKEECERNAANLGITYETCMERGPKAYDEIYFPVVMCPLNATPSGITGTVGPWGRCFIISDENIGPDNQEFLEELGSGHRYRYLRNIQKLDPFSGEADQLVNEFIMKLMIAQWNRQPQAVIEAHFNINIGGLGCHPYSIRVFFDNTLEPVTADEEVMCVD